MLDAKPDFQRKEIPKDLEHRLIDVRPQNLDSTPMGLEPTIFARFLLPESNALPLARSEVNKCVNIIDVDLGNVRHGAYSLNRNEPR